MGSPAKHNCSNVRARIYFRAPGPPSHLAQEETDGMSHRAPWVLGSAPSSRHSLQRPSTQYFVPYQQDVIPFASST